MASVSFNALVDILSDYAWSRGTGIFRCRVGVQEFLCSMANSELTLATQSFAESNPHSLYPTREQIIWLGGQSAVSCSLLAEPEAAPASGLIQVPIANVLMEMLRRASAAGLEPDTLVLHDRYVLRDDSQNLIQLSALTTQEAYVLSRLETPLKFSEIVALCPFKPAETRRILFRLWKSGLITKTSSGATENEMRAAAQPASDQPMTTAPRETDEVELSMDGETLDDYFAHEVDDTVHSIQSKNYYEFFDVPPNVSEEEIKDAYHRLAKKFHPDRYIGTAQAALRAKLEKIFSFLCEAYETLSHPASRAAYDEALRRGDFKSATVFAQPTSAQRAEASFLRGQQFFSIKDYPAATQCFHEAVYMEPNNPRYRNSLALALSKNPKARKEAEQHFLKAIEMEPQNASYYVGLGLLYRDVNMPLRARKQFETALQYDPSNPAAKRELGLEKKENGSAASKSGGLGSKLKGWFSKKSK